jgi:hypothetical protein
MMENHGLQKHLEIDRVDNSRHYEPGNLKWSSKTEQMLNNRRTRLPKGFVFRQEEWPYSKDITERRIKAGWTREQIFEAARQAVSAKSKNYIQIRRRLESMTF